MKLFYDKFKQNYSMAFKQEADDAHCLLVMLVTICPVDVLYIVCGCVFGVVTPKWLAGMVNGCPLPAM